MNNKGQVLIIFVIILPILLLLLALVIDYGTLSIETRNIENNIATVVEEEYTKEEIETLLKKNIKDAEIKVEENDVSINIEVIKKHKGILFFKNQEVRSSWVKIKE